MAKYIVTTARSEKSFSTYMGAVNYALRKNGGIVTDNGVSVPTIKVGGTVMYQNYVCRCVNLHQNTVDLHGEALQMGVNLMGIDPSECRELASVESIDFYRGQANEYLTAKTPSLSDAKKLLQEICRQINSHEVTTDVEGEQHCRLLGFRIALEQYMSR